MPRNTCAIAIHGGAGTRRAAISKRSLAQHLSELKKALRKAHRALLAGSSALDAVVIAISEMEDCPLFNAGRGSVFNADGKHEMDAALMDGNTLKAGAICGVSSVKNPIHLARIVLEQTPHILFTKVRAEQLAKEHSLAIMDIDYFRVDERWRDLEIARAHGRMALDHEVNHQDNTTLHEKFGTVGAVALDLKGDLAAGTSTGGLTNKMPGRVGDSPIIGSGTYANNSSVAVSCTGRGEEFMRHVLAHDLSMRVTLGKLTLNRAAQQTLKLLPQNCGGFVALNRRGQIVTPYNTEGMFRGYADIRGNIDVACF